MRVLAALLALVVGLRLGLLGGGGATPTWSPLPALLGGALLGAASSILTLFNGRIAGMSGIFGGILFRKAGDVAWRVAFVFGLLAGGVALLAFQPSSFPAAANRPLWLIAVAGLLIGYGARLGNGCTSGHGVCGLSRFSARSLVATITFIAAGMLTVFLSTHVSGGLR